MARGFAGPQGAGMGQKKFPHHAGRAWSMTKLCETRAKIPCFRPAPPPLPTPYRIYIGTQIIVYKRENVQIISYDNFISKTLYGINSVNFLFFFFSFFFLFFGVELCTFFDGHKRCPKYNGTQLCRLAELC